MVSNGMNSIFERYEKVIGWGAGKYFEHYYDLVKGKIDYLVDRNLNLHGQKKEGVLIKSISELEQEQNKETLLLVVFNRYFDEIVHEAKAIGDFDIIDIVTLKLLHSLKCEFKGNECKVNNTSYPVLVCGGIHALWYVNGARKFIDTQNEIFHANGFDTVEIAPVSHYYQNGDCHRPYMAVSFNKNYIRSCSISEIINEYTIVQSVIIHSLYEHHEILELLLGNVTVRKSILYYLHDYYCICENRFLFYQHNLCLNNENHLLCESCVNKKIHKELYRFHQSLFDNYGIKLIAPSKDTAERVRQLYQKNEIIVIPHLSYQIDEYRKSYRRELKIAYLGSMSWHKGWSDYIHIFEKCKEKYKFYCLGKYDRNNCVEGITYIDVSFEKERNNVNMVEALRKQDIDIVYLGARWPETFSYTYYEACEAGCFVITNEVSGNICGQVKSNGNGIVLKSVSDVMEWLTNDENVSNVVCRKNKRFIDVKPDETFLMYCT